MLIAEVEMPLNFSLVRPVGTRLKPSPDLVYCLNQRFLTQFDLTHATYRKPHVHQPDISSSLGRT